jgi:DNA-binding beta-propeller fold protein YncE
MCFISCEGSNEVRVINTVNDSLIKSISLPASPAMLQLSQTSNRLFVSCPFDSLSFSTNIGSVNVISASDLRLVKTINTGFQPFGLAINEADQSVTVANANIHVKGPSPHHVSGCGGRNGYLTVIDMRTLALIPGKKYELAVFPFDVTVKK